MIASRLSALQRLLPSDPFCRTLQLFIIRLYVGFDFLGHFPEKFGWLGPAAYREVFDYFAVVMPDPRHALLLAGLFELSACVGLGLGLCTRFAAVTTGTYLLVAIFAGHHNRIGFTWVRPGGGWEFAAMWACLCYSFALTGGGPWSIDRLLRPRLPSTLRWLCV